MAIGDRLEKLIGERHTNVNQLSLATGINAQTIYSIIRRNNTKVDLDVLQAIADELCVTLDYFTEREIDNDIFALKIKGHSMEPRIFDGDTVIVKKQDDVEDGEIAVAQIDGKDVTTKKIVKQEGGLLLVGLNAAAFTPKFFPADRIRIVGKVIEVRGQMSGWDKK